MAWIYLTGFIFLSLCSLKAFRSLPHADSVLAEYNTTKGNYFVDRGGTFYKRLQTQKGGAKVTLRCFLSECFLSVWIFPFKKSDIQEKWSKDVMLTVIYSRGTTSSPGSYAGHLSVFICEWSSQSKHARASKTIWGEVRKKIKKEKKKTTDVPKRKVCNFVNFTFCQF